MLLITLQGPRNREPSGAIINAQGMLSHIRPYASGPLDWSHGLVRGPRRVSPQCKFVSKDSLVDEQLLEALVETSSFVQPLMSSDNCECGTIEWEDTLLSGARALLC